MAGTPIWTAQKAVGLSGWFDVTDPPMTISVDRLQPHEVVHVRSANQDDSLPVPYRRAGNVQADYNNTKVMIFDKGKFCLEIEKEMADTEDRTNGIDATRI